MSAARPDLASQTARLSDRLRRMALTRLQAPYQPEATRIEAARAVTQQLADAAAALEQPDAPVWREVPQVPAESAGDLLAVCAHDVLAAADSLDDRARVPLRAGGTTTGVGLLDHLAGAARDLRLRL